MGWANTEGTNMDNAAKVGLMKFNVAPELMRVGIRSGIPVI